MTTINRKSIARYKGVPTDGLESHWSAPQVYDQGSFLLFNPPSTDRQTTWSGVDRWVNKWVGRWVVRWVGG